jgi:hypothetical protein
MRQYACGLSGSYRADPKLPDIPIVHASKVFCELTGVHLPIYCVIVKVQLDLCNEVLCVQLKAH